MNNSRFYEPSGNRPGFRIAGQFSRSTRDAVDAAEEERQDAYADADYENGIAWRLGFVLDADGREGPEGSQCVVKNAAFPDDFGAPGYIRDGVCTPDRPRKPATEMSLDSLYAEVERGNATAWRTGAPQATRNNSTRDTRPPVNDPRPLVQRLRDHEKRMDRVYAEHSANLRDAYKG